MLILMNLTQKKMRPRCRKTDPSFAKIKRKWTKSKNLQILSNLASDPFWDTLVSMMLDFSWHDFLTFPSMSSHHTDSYVWPVNRIRRLTVVLSGIILRTCVLFFFLLNIMLIVMNLNKT